MKTNPTDRMKNPFYAQLIFCAERLIDLTDQDAKTKGIELRDSQVRSAVIKTMKVLQGNSPDIPKSNERESLLAELIDDLVSAPQKLAVTTDDDDSPEMALDVSDWVKALETVADSIKTRKGDFPGSRLYLDFIHGFIARTRGRRK